MTGIVLDRVAERESTTAGRAPARTALRTGSRSEPPQPATAPHRTRRRASGSGRALGPVLRPAGSRPLPPSKRHVTPGPQACALPAPEFTTTPVAEAVPSWRLTERGVAVVLVIGLMIMAGALTVVGLTALKVTSEGYRPGVSASLPR